MTLFQSTPSAWRVTLHPSVLGNGHQISIHTLRVEGDRSGFVGRLLTWISIHTLRVEGDFAQYSAAFNDWFISIHTLRVEGDMAVELYHLDTLDFNPHPPRGG